MSRFTSKLASETAWVEPSSLPNYGDVSEISGNAPYEAKQLTCNVLHAYGLGSVEGFGYNVGKAIRIVELDVDKSGEVWKSTALAEVVVSEEMLNGAGVMHGGVMCFLIDNCASLPLVALGAVKGTNGVGVSQSLNVLFHAPAMPGSHIVIKSSVISLGARVMTSRCKVTDKATGREIASAILSKMQPSSIPPRL